MINFRFHLISLIAVFLALAVGVVMGYAVLGQPTVDTLQGRVDTVEARADAVRAENDRLRSEQARLESVLDDAGEFAVTSRLAGESVVPVAVRGVDADKVTETVQLARTAGAVVPGIVWLEEKWALRSDDDAAELAEIIGSTGTTRSEVREDAARALAVRLAAGPIPAQTPTPTGSSNGNRTDLLVELDDAGFLGFDSVDDIPFEAARLDARASRVLLAGGTAAAMPADRGVVPLARALIDAGRLVVVADAWSEVEQGPTRGEELRIIRDDNELSTQVATIDNLDTLDGPLAAVLALADRNQGTIGHYGFGAGADRALPVWWIV